MNYADPFLWFSLKMFKESYINVETDMSGLLFLFLTPRFLLFFLFLFFCVKCLKDKKKKNRQSDGLSLVSPDGENFCYCLWQFCTDYVVLILFLKC